MSFIIKGGYDAIRKQVLNISLKRTNKWTTGTLLVKKDILVYNLVPRYDNEIELVKYNDVHALLLNNTIIYEDKKLFSYKLNLQGFNELLVYDSNPHDYLEYKYVDYYAMKHFAQWRTLN
jgi:hypothetical protein